MRTQFYSGLIAVIAICNLNVNLASALFLDARENLTDMLPEEDSFAMTDVASATDAERKRRRHHHHE